MQMPDCKHGRNADPLRGAVLHAAAKWLMELSAQCCRRMRPWSLLPGIDLRMAAGACAQVDVLAEALMPPGVRSLRAMLHATAVEVLLYLTPLHCQDMLGSLVAAMNAQFAKFMLRHPHFQARCPLHFPIARSHASLSWHGLQRKRRSV